MRNEYRIEGTSSMANVSKYRYRTYTIEMLYVAIEERGKGFGRHLLKQILNDADKFGVKLRLLVAPQGGLSFTQLVAWYERNGFVEESLLCFERQPKGVIDNVPTLRDNASEANLSSLRVIEVNKY